MKLFLTWTSGSGEDVIYKISYLEFWLSSCSEERNHLGNFKEDITGNIHVKLF